MFTSLANKIFGTPNDRALKPYRRKLATVNALEPTVAALSDTALRARTDEMRGRLAAGESLEALIPDAFATVREATRRVLGLRHHDVQVIGGMVLNDGAIAEMKTGEGKTIVALLAAYLNALPGKGVHVVTVNDYLAKRDADQIGRVLRFLGLSVGAVVPGLSEAERREAYACDVTYGTNSEFGFDYLRDNLAMSFEAMVQRGHAFAIVDEVDSILVDEARLPLLISAHAPDRSELYLKIDAAVASLTGDDYSLDEKQRSVSLTEEGNDKVEDLLREAGVLGEGALYDAVNSSLYHHVNVSLQAHKLYVRDREYVLKDGEAVIIDPFSGRMQIGRRFGDGLHQAIEAKEGLAIQPETETLASISYQNYFRMYGKLSGMTGTAATEADEFRAIYGLEVIEIPTNVPVARKDDDDEVYPAEADKLKAVVAEIEASHARMQPVLVGTASIEKSEQLAGLLESKGWTRIEAGDPDGMAPVYAAAKAGVPGRRFAVLNAKSHAQEAFIVAQAGIPGAVTVATNMAGRGTDVQLGGSAEMRVRHELLGVEEGPRRDAAEQEIAAQCAAFKEAAKSAGGLYVIGTERHESRRMDNQLRGRSGRQGDPGRSKFFLSLDDDLLRIFGDALHQVVERLELAPGEAVSNALVSKLIHKAQTKVEQRNFDVRRELVKFDDIVNDQRQAVFSHRNELLAADSLRDEVKDLRHEVVEATVRKFLPEDSYPEQWDLDALRAQLASKLNLQVPVGAWAKEEGVGPDDIVRRTAEMADEAYDMRVAIYTDEAMRHAERHFMILVLDAVWREHIATLDHLRKVIVWRSIAQRDPVVEFRTEAVELLQHAMDRHADLVTRELMRVQVRRAESEPRAA